ncbi:hypothetical protein SHI21_12865 [Bacteriovorax sp. PP10]|uniref:HD domain-containing protein n=1 Tax=Bacteriovorax antarcticus TaxID=3088717 RepID=A0ABU5VVN2_9BACT|nr:hypothetical protein [Bacteriovorax sp. PP10]MEA9357109.1 hypothetical protein [Bacteriovorax sp. PP10]
MLEIFSEIDIVICTESFSTKIFENLIKNYEESKKAIDVLVLGNVRTPYPQARSIKYPSSPRKIINSLKEILGIKDEVEEQGDVKLRTLVGEAPAAITYSAINRLYFKELHQVKFPFNVYSRIKKNSGFEYLLKISAGATLSENEMERLMLRTGKEFFVMDKNFEEASLFLHENLMNKFHQENITTEKKMHLNSDCFEIIMDLFKNETIDKSISIVVKQLISSWKQAIVDPESLNNFISNPINKKLFYGYRHSYMTCLLMLQCSKHFVFRIERIEIKMLYLCLFHDMTLQNERLLKLHHNFEKERGQLSEEEMIIVLEHSHRAALKLESMINSPEELISLIREHHGMKSGKMFADNLSLSISPLNMVFMVVEDFVTNFINAWDKSADENLAQEQIGVIVNELKVKYSKLIYKDAVDALEKIVNAG